MSVEVRADVAKSLELEEAESLELEGAESLEVADVDWDVFARDDAVSLLTVLSVACRRHLGEASRTLAEAVGGGKVTDDLRLAPRRNGDGMVTASTVEMEDALTRRSAKMACQRAAHLEMHE